MARPLPAPHGCLPGSGGAGGKQNYFPSVYRGPEARRGGWEACGFIPPPGEHSQQLLPPGQASQGWQLCFQRELPGPHHQGLSDHFISL